MIPTVNQHKIILTNTTFDPPQSITFYGILPDDIQEQHSANFTPMEIQSRSGPLFAYSSGSARAISLDFDVHEDYLAEYNGGSADIREYAANFKALTYPEYMGTKVIPPSVLLRVGTFILFKGICTNASVTWQKPIRNGRYILAKFSISLEEANVNCFAASEIFAMDDIRRT